MLIKLYIWRNVLGDETIEIDVLLTVDEDVLEGQAAVCFIVTMKLEDGLSYFDKCVNFCLEVEPVLSKDFFNWFILVIGDKVEDPSIKIFFYH